MVTLLETWQKANEELVRLFAEKRVILADSTRLKIQGIMHELALSSFRAGHASGSDLRAKQITDICGAVLRDGAAAEVLGPSGE